MGLGMRVMFMSLSLLVLGTHLVQTGAGSMHVTTVSLTSHVSVSPAVALEEAVSLVYSNLSGSYSHYDSTSA